MIGKRVGTHVVHFQSLSVFKPSCEIFPSSDGCVSRIVAPENFFASSVSFMD